MIDTVVGYTGGTTESPTYQSIGDHTEALRVTFDQRTLPLEELLEAYWKGHTPMPMAFTGTQYRSAIFVHSQSQRAVAEHVRTTLSEASTYKQGYELTALEKAGPFYRAEEYHRASRALGPVTAGCFTPAVPPAHPFIWTVDAIVCGRTLSCQDEGRRLRSGHLSVP